LLLRASIGRLAGWVSLEVGELEKEVSLSMEYAPVWVSLHNSGGVQEGVGTTSSLQRYTSKD
jgi:hypothetical protein